MKTQRKTMRIMPLLLTACLLASFGCDPDFDFNLGLDSELLTVTVMTAGENLDADGYTLSVTGKPATTIGINASRTFSVLNVDHTVELRGIAPNCTTTNNPRTVSVTGPTTTTFVVECS